MTTGQFDVVGASPLISANLPPEAAATELDHRVRLSTWTQDLQASVALIVIAAAAISGLLFFFSLLSALNVYGNELIIGSLAFNALVGLRLSLAAWTGRPDLERERLHESNAEAIAAVGFLLLVGIHYFLGANSTLFESIFICAIPFVLFALAGTTIYDRPSRVRSLKTFCISWLKTASLLGLFSFAILLSGGDGRLSRIFAYLGLLAAMSFLLTSIAWLRSIWFFQIVRNWRIPLFEAGVGFALLCLFGAVVVMAGDGVASASDAYLKVFPFGILATALLAHLAATHHAHWMSADERLDGDRMRLWKARWAVSLEALKQADHPEAVAYRRTLAAIPLAYGVGYLVLLKFNQTSFHPGPFFAASAAIVIVLGLFRVLDDLWSGRVWISPWRIVSVSGRALLNWLCYNRRGIYAAGVFHSPVSLFRPCAARRAAVVACLALLAAPIILSPIEIKIKELVFGRLHQTMSLLFQIPRDRVSENPPISRVTPEQDSSSLPADRDQRPGDELAPKPPSLKAAKPAPEPGPGPEPKPNVLLQTPPAPYAVDGVPLSQTEKTYYDAVATKEGKARYLREKLRLRHEREKIAAAFDKAKAIKAELKTGVEKARRQVQNALEGQGEAKGAKPASKDPAVRRLAELTPQIKELLAETKKSWSAAALATARFILLKMLTVICAALLPALFLIVMTTAVAGRALAAFEQAVEADAQSARLNAQSIWDSRIDRVMNSKNKMEREHLYLGRSIVDDVPVWLPLPLLKMHAHIVGDSGSRKTALGVMPLMSQLVARAQDDRDEGAGPSSLIIIDLKGDMALFETARLEAERAGLEFKWFTNVSGSSSFVFNPLAQLHRGALTPNQRSQGLAQALSLEYGEGYGRGHFSALSEGILTRTFERFPEIESFDQLRKRWSSPVAFEAVGDRDDWKQAKHLLNLIGKLGQMEPLNASTPKEGDGPAARAAWARRIDMGDVFQRSQVVYFSLAALLEPTTVSPIAKLAIMALLQASVLRPAREKNQVYVFIDEFQRILSENIGVMMEQARSMKIAFILSNQTLSQLDQRELRLSEIVESCTAFKQVFRASDLPTLKRLEEQSGMALERRIRWRQEIIPYADDLGFSSPLDPTIAAPASGQGTETTWTARSTDALYSSFGTGRAVTTASGPPNLAARQVEVQEVEAAKLSRGEILRISSQPMNSLVKFTEDSGFVQYGGGYIGLACEYPMTSAVYQERSNAAWPPRDERTLVVGKPEPAAQTTTGPGPGPGPSRDRSVAANQATHADRSPEAVSSLNAQVRDPSPAPGHPPGAAEIERQLAEARRALLAGDPFAFARTEVLSAAPRPAAAAASPSIPSTPSAPSAESRTR